MSAASRIKMKGVRPAITANGGVDGAAATVDKHRSHAGRWLNRNVPDQPTLPDAYALDEVALAELGRAPILEACAAELGYVAIRLPGEQGHEDCIVLSLAEAAAEFGDVANAITDAVRDHKRTPKENARIVREIDEAQARLSRLRLLATTDDEETKGGLKSEDS